MVEANPEDGESRVARALAHERMGDLAAAKPDLAPILKSDPSNAVAHRIQGHLRVRAGDHRGAIRSLNKAIASGGEDPRNFTTRGLAFAVLGDDRRAIKDFDQALGHDRRNVAALSGRAMARFRTGLHAAAIPDFAKALRQEPDNVDLMLWLYLSEKRSGVGGRKRLAAAARRVSDKGGWPEAILALYLGSGGEGRVLAQAEHGDTTMRARQRCEGNYFLGQNALLEGDSAQALAHFRAALGSGLTTLPAYLAAKAELRKLGS